MSSTLSTNKFACSSSPNIPTNINLHNTKDEAQYNNLLLIQNSTLICGSSALVGSSVKGSVEEFYQPSSNSTTVTTPCVSDSTPPTAIQVPILLLASPETDSKLKNFFKDKPPEQTQKKDLSCSFNISAKQRVALPFLNLILLPEERQNSSSNQEVQIIDDVNVLEKVGSNHSNIVGQEMRPPNFSPPKTAVVVDSHLFIATGFRSPREDLRCLTTPSVAVQESQCHHSQFTIDELRKTLPKVISNNNSTSNSCKSSITNNHLNNGVPQRQISYISVASTHGTPVSSNNQNDEWMMSVTNLEELHHSGETNCYVNHFQYWRETGLENQLSPTKNKPTRQKDQTTIKSRKPAATTQFPNGCSFYPEPYFIPDQTLTHSSNDHAIEEPIFYNSINSHNSAGGCSNTTKPEQQQAFSNSSSLCHCPCRNCSACPVKVVPQSKMKMKNESPRFSRKLSDKNAGNIEDTDDDDSCGYLNRHQTSWWSRFRLALTNFYRMEAENDLEKFKYDIHVIPEPPLPKGTQRLLEITELPFLILWVSYPSVVLLFTIISEILDRLNKLG